MRSYSKFKSMLVLVFFTLVLFNSLQAKEILEKRGGKVKAVKYDDGTWELLVDDKPYFIKGVIFTPVKIGETPAEATMRDWMYYDDNHDGKNDTAFETWLDVNNNDKKDPSEEKEGDFSLLKKMGCNTIRLYHVASDNPILKGIYTAEPGTALQYNHAENKAVLRSLYKDYGIMVIMSNFLGSWTIGSGATWDEGTDYANPAHRENIKKSVKAMILDNKEEPYVLMWLLGNENNIADWSRCNAKEKPKEYATLIGELADMIHELDPEHPVAVCDGDNQNTLQEYAKYAQGIDIVAYNAYRGKFGFGNLWKSVKRVLDRPVFISEFGMFAYNKNTGEDQDTQEEYLKGCWKDIVNNSAQNYAPDKKTSGNSLGGVIFDWLDRWYMDGSPSQHGFGANYSPFSSDNLRHEEWFGVMSMGNGKDWLKRQKRKAYDYFKDVWNAKGLSY